MGFSQLLGNPELNIDKKKYYIKVINNNGKQLLNLINDIIDISKIESQQLEILERPFNLNELLEELKGLMELELKNQNKAQIMVSLTINLPNDQAYIKTDDFRLKQILMNLLTNAVKFTNKGQISFGYQLKQDQLCFFVQDTGVGIKKELKELVFERFNQADSSPTREFGGPAWVLPLPRPAYLA
ncbi:MAG: hypothetical protein HC896_02435 [Bacteroidales bacterium]|nr:hypothetical protein [Bacteroidales bacterium]